LNLQTDIVTYTSPFSFQFSHAEHERFARLSGDVNPMHMDPLAARRTQAGDMVVHGMHVLLRCFEGMVEYVDSEFQCAGVMVRFLRPVLAGDKVDYYLLSEKESGWKLKAQVADVVVARIRIHSRVRGVKGGCEQFPVEKVSRQADLHDFGDIAGCKGGLTPPGAAEEFRNYLPNCASVLGVQAVCELSALSTVVGMRCPGLYSILSSLNVDFLRDGAHKHLSYRLASAEEKYRLLELDVNGASLRGRVDAFLRVPPVSQRSIGDVSQKVEKNEFEDQVALVVGGSRGLGELTAKIVAAGGGYPIITYAVGRDDANHVAQQIVDHGCRCDTMQLDVTKPLEAQLHKLSEEVTQLYYFATPQIFRRKSAAYDPAVFRIFSQFYCDAFVELVGEVVKRQDRELSVFYPSTTAIEERPDGLTEYSMAKVAGEILCQDVPRWIKGVTIEVERLPRILTDQTVTMTEVESADAVGLLLPIIRRCHASG